MRHVVPVSGGKDSTSLALRLAEVEPRDYEYVCTPTGDELPDWFAHMRGLSAILGKPILPIMHRAGLNGLIAEQRAIPNYRMRFCTRMLKIEPFAAWLMLNAPATVYVGLRADEEEREGGDYATVPGATMRFPLREWGWNESDVLAYLEQRGVTIPERTDCARCFFQTLGEWWVLWKEHPDLYASAEGQETEIGHTFRSPQRDSWPAPLSELRAEFEKGRIPPRTALQRDLFRNMQCRVCRL